MADGVAKAPRHLSAGEPEDGRWSVTSGLPTRGNWQSLYVRQDSESSWVLEIRRTDVGTLRLVLASRWSWNWLTSGRIANAPSHLSAGEPVDGRWNVTSGLASGWDGIAMCSGGTLERMERCEHLGNWCAAPGLGCMESTGPCGNRLLERLGTLGIP